MWLRLAVSVEAISAFTRYRLSVRSQGPLSVEVDGLLNAEKAGTQYLEDYSMCDVRFKLFFS